MGGQSRWANEDSIGKSRCGGSMNLLTIYPYLLGNTWVFDDERTGLKEEAFVLGMTEMISRVVKARTIPNAEEGFALTFAAEPFDHNVELAWLPPADAAKALDCASSELPNEGNWY